MSNGANAFFRDSLDEVAPRATIHQLPVELLAMTMAYLPFSDKVHISHVDARLRKIALGRSDLWEEIILPIRRSPVAPIDKLMARARADRPLSVTILNVGPDNVNNVSRFIGSYLGRFKQLAIRFEDVHLDEEALDDYRWSLHSLWQSFSLQPATQLEILTLQVMSAGERVPLSLLPSDIFNGQPPPLLRLLYVRGFEFEDPCPAFARVAQVSTTLASLSRFHSIGELFPGAAQIIIREMESFIVTDVDDDGNEYQSIYATLQDLPPIDGDHRVRELHLIWGPVRQIYDPDAVDWIARSAPFITKLMVACPHLIDVSAATLAYTGRDDPTMLQIAPKHLGLFCLNQEGKAYRFGAAATPPDDSYANSLITHLDWLTPRLQRLFVHSSCMAALAVVPPNLPELRTVVITLDSENVDVNGRVVLPALAVGFPSLPNITNLHLGPSPNGSVPFTLDARSVLQVVPIFPKLRQITVHKPVILSEDRVLEAFLPKLAI